jgi:3-oxoacyl-[acyl-carrier-protein] synthase III
MTPQKQSHIHVLSTGKYIPSHRLTNADLEKLVETSDEWITSRTGIKNRFIAKDDTVAEMATKAAKAAIDKAGVALEEIDLLVVASISGKQMTPSTANFVAGYLGLTHPHLMSFDVNAACTGFIYALETAYALLETKKFKHALIIGAEKLSDFVDYTDRNTCVLFGDGAGAILVTYDETKLNDKSYFYNASKPDLEDTLTVKNVIAMDGRKVYQFAVDAMEKSIERILSESGYQIDDITQVIPHQANERIISAVAKNMKLPAEKVFVNIASYGNTSAASIPICLDEYLEAHPKTDQNIVMVGFGGGFTWGSALLSIKGLK